MLLSHNIVILFIIIGLLIIFISYLNYISTNAINNIHLSNNNNNNVDDYIIPTPIFNKSYNAWADKWFPEHSSHYDARYYNGEVKDRIKILMYLFQKLDIILQKYNVTYWLDSGSLLGSHRDGKIIEWDEDGDIGVMRNDLRKLPLESYINDTYLQINPNFVYTNIQNKNQVDGRFIHTGTGVYIDFFAFVKRKSKHNGKSYLVSKWFDGYSENEFGFLNHLYDEVFPLVKCNLSYFITNCPYKTAGYLLDIYTTLEPPGESFDPQIGYESKS